MIQRWPRILVATLCLLAVATSVFAQVLTSPSGILASPGRFGNRYSTFDLSDGTQAIHVFSFGPAPCRAGGATVEGTFEKVKRQGRYTFYNEVTATKMTCC